MASQSTFTASNKSNVESKQALTTSRSKVLLSNVAALAFGAVILFAVGFMSMPAAHNAAHDTRHALAFPCH